MMKGDGGLPPSPFCPLPLELFRGTFMKLRVLMFLVCFSLMCAAAHAEVILEPKAAGWEYTFTDPTSDAAWNTMTGLGGPFGWVTGQAPFGNQTTGDPDFIYNTLWAGDTVAGVDDLWVRRTVDLTGWNFDTIRWDLGVDNGFKLYANGVFVAGDTQDGYTFRWEYADQTFGALNAFLVPGMNVIAVAMDDYGVATAFDMEITGTPEPGSMILLGTGLLGLASAMRRRGKTSA
jgi:hypothetical protein